VELFKLHVQNLGRIREAELSIRPLTVFMGPNNTNKTWTAYALYGLAKAMAWPFSPLRDVDASGSRHGVSVGGNLSRVREAAVSRVLASRSKAPAGRAIVKEVRRQDALAGVDFPARLSLHTLALARLIGAVPDDLWKAEVCLLLSEEQFARSWTECVLFELPADLGDDVNVEFRDRDGDRLNGLSFAGSRGEEELGLEQVVRSSIGFLALNLVKRVAVFPAERKALVSTFDLLKDEALDLLSAPVGDFVQFLRSSQRLARRDTHEGVLSGTARLLEERILDGKVQFDPQANLTYTQLNAPPLRMQASASLVRALAGLDIYLHQMAEPGDLLVIDEPEMNAHPEAQLMIAELLGILVNKGINIVITTHSPYIVDHINNLSEAGRVPEDRRPELAERFRLKTAEAFVPPENVATYTFGEDGRVTDVFNRDTGIVDWETFGKQSDYVGNLYGDILEALPRK